MSGDLSDSVGVSVGGAEGEWSVVVDGSASDTICLERLTGGC